MTHKFSAIVPHVVVFLSLLFASSAAKAADGQILITHSKIVAGNVTPGDSAGYPARLTRSGSYILGSDLAPGPNLDAIVVASSDVAIDLNGFKISGGPAGGINNARYGIFGAGDRLTVRNGTITGFENSAIHAPNRLYLVVEHMRLINSLRGIYNDGGRVTRIQNSTIASNVDRGIVCEMTCHVEGSVVAINGNHGIHLVAGTILGNTIDGNGGYGVYVEDGIVGFGNNTLTSSSGSPVGKNSGGATLELLPNVCVPACPW